MTIEYKDSKRIVKLSTDVTETASALWGTSANQAIEDFTTYTDQADADTSWVSTDTTNMRVNVSTDVLDFQKTTSNRIYYDLGVGNISDSAFVLRAKLNITTHTALDATGVGIVLSADTNSGGSNGEWLGLTMVTDQDIFSAQSAENGSLSQGTASSDEIMGLETGVKYLEISRLSTTSYKVELFSDSGFSTSLGSQTKTIASTLGSFRYIKVMQKWGTAGQLLGTVDDFQFYNGVTSVDSKPTDVPDNSILIEKDTAKRYWFDSGLAPTFEDDFTSYATQGAADAVWVEDGTGKVAVNITDNDIDFNLKTETTAHGINYDFGVGNVSDTEWIIRYKMNLTTVNTTTMYTYWGLSSVSGSGTSTTRDFIGFNTTGTAFSGHDRDGADDTGGGDNSQSYTLVTGKDYYVTIKRTSATAYAYTLQTGSFSGTTVVNGTGTCASTIVGLRYFNCRNLNNQTTAGNLIGTIDDFEFYNGVTSVTPATWTLGGFQPTDISSLAHWYDASDLDSITKDSSTNRVSQWNDKKGSDNLTESTSGDQPLWTDADQNSKAVIDFVSSRGLSNNASSVAQPNTYFVALTAPASTGTTRRPFTSGNQQVFTSASANSWGIYAGSQPAFSGDIGTSFQIWEITFNGSSSSWKINNVSKISGQNAGTGTAGSLDMGKPSDNYANNKVGEFIRYDGTLTDAQKTSVYNYLKKKWGL